VYRLLTAAWLGTDVTVFETQRLFSFTTVRAFLAFAVLILRYLCLSSFPVTSFSIIFKHITIWAGHVARIGETRNAYTILVGSLEWNIGVNGRIILKCILGKQGLRV
jgi:hypothetical protein